jgi:hypothetical protein
VPRKGVYAALTGISRGEDFVALATYGLKALAAAEGRVFLDHFYKSLLSQCSHCISPAIIF